MQMNELLDALETVQNKLYRCGLYHTYSRLNEAANTIASHGPCEHALQVLKTIYDDMAWVYGKNVPMMTDIWKILNEVRCAVESAKERAKIQEVYKVGGLVRRVETVQGWDQQIGVITNLYDSSSHRGSSKDFFWVHWEGQEKSQLAHIDNIQPHNPTPAPITYYGCEGTTCGPGAHAADCPNLDVIV